MSWGGRDEGCKADEQRGEVRRGGVMQRMGERLVGDRGEMGC